MTARSMTTPVVTYLQNAKHPNNAQGQPLKRWYGNRASDKTYGHAGATGMVGFADPDRRLVVAGIGFTGEQMDLIYEDLKMI